MAGSNKLVTVLATVEIQDVRKHIVSCYEPNESRQAALGKLDELQSLLGKCEPMDLAADESEELAYEIAESYAVALKQMRTSMLLIGA